MDATQTSGRRRRMVLVLWRVGSAKPSPIVGHKKDSHHGRSWQPAGELAEALSRSVEAVCRHYLPARRRSGHYWIVGDVDNAPGRSLYVRLTGPTSGKGAAGRWCDAAMGQHGDLLDPIRLDRGYGTLSDAMDEARSFLALPSLPDPTPTASLPGTLGSLRPAPTQASR